MWTSFHILWGFPESCRFLHLMDDTGHLMAFDTILDKEHDAVRRNK